MKTEFSDNRIRIRPYRADDIPHLFEAARESIADAFPWLPWCHPDYSPDECSTWVSSRGAAWEKGEDYSFAVFDADGDVFLGGVGLNFINPVHRVANLGYWVRSSRTGRGVASSAARLAARFGLEEAGFQRLEILAAVGNGASQRVAEKAGARREGILRKRLLAHNVSQDAVLYSLVIEDLKL